MVILVSTRFVYASLRCQCRQLFEQHGDCRWGIKSSRMIMVMVVSLDIAPVLIWWLLSFPKKSRVEVK